MSDFASVVDRARRAFATVARLESAIAREPASKALQINLVSARKLAQQSQEMLLALSEQQRIEVCNYRLLPEAVDRFFLQAVSRSFLEYQNLFTQVHDAIRNGAKQNAVWGAEAERESSLELAYTYSGSLGVVLLAPSERDFFEGKLDRSIDALFSVLDVGSRSAVRDVAQEFGNAVVKRVHDWSKVNLNSGFATDLRWNRSDGRQLGRVVERHRMSELVDLIVATSDEKHETLNVQGVLVGGDLNSNSFHFVVPNGRDFRGSISKSFPEYIEMTLGKTYRASILETRTTVYATDRVNMKHELMFLGEIASEVG